MNFCYFFKTPLEFRTWLEENHDKATEVYIGYYRVATGKPTMTWSESVDQAICFGWIDGVRRKIDEESYCNRFTPRRLKSNWSDVNHKKYKDLKAKGHLHPAGIAVYERNNPKKKKILNIKVKKSTKK